MYLIRYHAHEFTEWKLAWYIATVRANMQLLVATKGLHTCLVDAYYDRNRCVVTIRKRVIS